jgi:molybdate transport system substrate-binding protein
MRALRRSGPWSVCLLALAALGCGKAAAMVEIDVYAAASLRDVLTEFAPVAERELGVKPVYNFGSSGDLSKQIVAAGKADVFLSADEQEMDKVEQAGMLLAGTRRPLWTNLLVVIEPKDGTKLADPFTPEQLHQPAITHLALANTESAPAGRYAKAWLEARGEWAKVSERVLPTVDVRAALAAVESGAAQAGIVYRTMRRARRACAWCTSCRRPGGRRSRIRWRRSRGARARTRRGASWRP